MKKFMSLFLAGVLAISLVGCGASKEEGKIDNNKPVESGETTEEGDTLKVGMDKGKGAFSPIYYQAGTDYDVCKLIFQGLLKVDEKGESVPDIAESYEISEDGTEITFKMKKDIVFSDGEKLTADDVIFTYQVLCDPSYTGRITSTTQNLRGYEDYKKSETEDFKCVEKIDDYTVKFNFVKAERENFLNCGVEILAKHYYGKDFKKGDTAGVESFTDKPFGCGPYTLKKFEPDQFVALTKNEKYKGEGYKIKNIIGKYKEDTTELEEITSGTIDLLPEIFDAAKLNVVKKNENLTSEVYPRAGYGTIHFNCEAGATRFKEVRQALYYSFNVKEFVESYFKCDDGEVTAEVQYHPFAHGVWGVDDQFLKDITKYEYDIEKAKKILDDAGWKVGDSGYREKDGEILELKIAAMPDHAILNTVIPMWEKSWGTELNGKLEIVYLGFDALLSYVYEDSDKNVNDWSAYFMGTSFNGADPGTLYTEFHSSNIGGGLDNTGRYKNAEVDKILEDARVVYEKEKAEVLYGKMGRIINEDAPTIPVYASLYHDIHTTRLKNYKPNTFCGWTKAIKDATIDAETK